MAHFLCPSTLISNVAVKNIHCSGYFIESEVGNNLIIFFPIETKIRIKNRIVNSYFLFFLTTLMDL